MNQDTGSNAALQPIDPGSGEPRLAPSLATLEQLASLPLSMLQGESLLHYIESVQAVFLRASQLVFS